ncbi:MAG: hypothetical protein DRK00_10635, partial [Thermoprotei archaeon]
LREERAALLEISRGEQPSKAPQGLLELGLVKASRGVYELAIPLLRGGDKEVVTSAVVEVAHDAAEELVSRYDIIERAYEALGYSRWLEGVGDFVELAIHAVMALSIEELVERGALPPIPGEAPASWGVWLWEPPWTLDLKVLYHHALEELREVMERQGPRGGVVELVKRAEELAEKGEYHSALKVLEKAVDTYRQP